MIFVSNHIRVHMFWYFNVVFLIVSFSFFPLFTGLEQNAVECTDFLDRTNDGSHSHVLIVNKVVFFRKVCLHCSSSIWILLPLCVKIEWL